MHIVDEQPHLKRNYEQIVASDERFGFFAQAWVQECLHPTWKYLVNEQEQILLRVPVAKKFGFQAYLQPLFIRSLAIVDHSSTPAIVQFLKQKFLLHLNLNLSSSDCASIGMYQKLTWNNGINEIRGGYSANVKRSLKKAVDLKLKAITYQDFQTFFVAQKGENLGSLNKDSWVRLAQLFIKARAMDAAFCVGAFDQEELVSVGLFFKWKSSLYFMKGTLNDNGKKKGALVFLIDTVLEQFSTTHHALDFIGSNQQSIADFYRKFGAKDHKYCIVKGRIPIV